MIRYIHGYKQGYAFVQVGYKHLEAVKGNNCTHCVIMVYPIAPNADMKSFELGGKGAQLGFRFGVWTCLNMFEPGGVWCQGATNICI